MRLLTWLIGVAVAVFMVTFAVSNRTPVSVTVWPFPFALDLGLYIIILGAALLGFVVGALVTWVAGGKHRRQVRRQRNEIRNLEGELNDTRARLAEGTTIKAAKAA